MKIKIRLDTLSDVKDFVAISTAIPEDVIVTDNCGMRVNGKSLMGMLYSLEFKELWCESTGDNYISLSKFITE